MIYIVFKIFVFIRVSFNTALLIRGKCKRSFGNPPSVTITTFSWGSCNIFTSGVVGKVGKWRSKFCILSVLWGSNFSIAHLQIDSKKQETHSCWRSRNVRRLVAWSVHFRPQDCSLPNSTCISWLNPSNVAKWSMRDGEGARAPLDQ